MKRKQWKERVPSVNSNKDYKNDLDLAFGNSLVHFKTLYKKVLKKLLTDTSLKSLAEDSSILKDF